MKIDKIRQIAVIGAGLMGHGIALEFARAGYKVFIHDLNEHILQQAVNNIQEKLQMLAKIGFIANEQTKSITANINKSTLLKEVVKDADVVIETVSEDLILKQQIFQKLDSICHKRTIFTSNTSTFMPSKLSLLTKRPDRILVTHFFNPPYLLPIVEIVPSKQTSNETIKTIIDFLSKAGKNPITVKREVSGFIANRLQAALFREAVSIVEKGIADPQDVDIVIKNGFGRRYAVAGIFELSDIAGLDVGLALTSQLLPDLDSSLKPTQVLKEKVDRGELGVKTGKGFYEWTPKSAESLKQEIAKALIKINQLA